MVIFLVIVCAGVMSFMCCLVCYFKYSWRGISFYRNTYLFNNNRRRQERRERNNIEVLPNGMLLDNNPMILDPAEAIKKGVVI